MIRFSKCLAVALASVILIASGAVNLYASNTPRDLDKKMEKANTPEKREAIAHIRDLFEKYNRRHVTALKIVDYILEADRNVPTLARLAEYAIAEGSNTMTYIDIAGQAAKAPLADKEFLQIAELTKKSGSGFLDVAKEAARAKTDAELQDVRVKIAVLASQTPAIKTPAMYVSEIDTTNYMSQLDEKLKMAQTDEKRVAITHIRDLFEKYNRHYLAMKIVDYIIAADRNVPILAKLAEYAITQGSGTTVYIEIAEQASKAPPRR